jgi:hypothetical protein
MARKPLFDIAQADTGRLAYAPAKTTIPAQADSEPAREREGEGGSRPRRPQPYREGKRAVMFFLPPEAFSEMHVLLARQGRRKVQDLMEELVDDWLRREGAPRLVR